MKNLKNITKMATVMPVLLALLLAGCSLDAPSDPTGDVNPPGVADAGARYVAVGNSLTAGFMDGGLMQVGQANSFPRLIATQLGLGADDFTQPWIKAPGIGSSTPSDPANVAGVLYFNGGISVLGETAAADVQSELLLAVTQPTAYHNLGVPGAWLVDGLNAYDAASSMSVVIDPTSPNLFFEFINRSSFFGNKTLTATLPNGVGGTYDVDYASGSMIYKAIAKGGALATMWLGNNDVLGPATSGNPAPGFGPAGAAAFQAEYTNALSILAGGLAKRNGFPATIVVANIPDISSVPYLMTVETFNGFLATIDPALAGGWPAGYEEADVQLVLFPTLSWAATHNPLTDPIPGENTLTSAEQTDVNTAVATYNAVISGVAQAVNASGAAKVGLMDANTLLADMSDLQRTHFIFLLGAGMDVPTAAGTTYFSLDGIHPNNVGYGVVANAFIDVINDLDGSSIPQLDLANLSWDPTYGVPLPAPTATRAPLTVSPAAATAMTGVFR